MKILNLKMPFFILYIVAGVIFVGNVVLAEHYFLGGNVLGAKTSNERKISNEKKKSANLDSKSKKNPKSLNISKVKNVSVELKKVSKRSDVVNNEELNTEINDIANEIDSSIARGIVHAKKVEDRPAWKRFLLGPDYKNLGQLRSGLVHMDNGIRKLERVVERSNDGSSSALQLQLEELVTQRESIVSMIKERESGFSLFGWVSKLLSGYKGGAIENIEINTNKTDTEIEESVEEMSETIDTGTETQEQEEIVEENVEVSGNESETDL